MPTQNFLKLVIDLEVHAVAADCVVVFTACYGPIAAANTSETHFVRPSLSLLLVSVHGRGVLRRRSLPECYVKSELVPAISDFRSLNDTNGIAEKGQK